MTRPEYADEFMLIMERTMMSMGAIMRRETRELGLNPPQFHLLRMLQAKGDMAVTEIADIMMVRPPTASRMIDSLCSKGMLIKEKDPDDNRVFMVRLTASAEEVLARVAGVKNQALMEVLQGENEEELSRTLKHLDRLSVKWFEYATEE